MMRALWIAPTILLMTVACGDLVPKGGGLQIAQDSLALRSEVLAEAPIFGRVGPIAIDASHLFLADWSGDPFVHVVDRRSGQLAYSIGKQGEGPGDFRSVFALFSTANQDGGVWAFDPVSRRLTHLDFDSEGKRKPIRTVPLSGSGAIMRLAQFGVGYLGWGPTDSSGVYVFLDSSGKELRRSAALLLGGDSIPLKLRIAASANLSLCVRPNKGTFATAFYSAGRIELHDSTGKLISLVQVPLPSNGDFVTSERTGRLVWRRERIHYTSCVTTPGYLIALYSGQSDLHEPGKPSSESHYSQTLHVFDWDGALVRIVHLDHPVTDIALDRVTGELFGSAQGEGKLLKFDLPPDALLKAR